jgi:hypothetical protein
MTDIATVKCYYRFSLPSIHKLCSRQSSRSQILCKLQLVCIGSSVYVYASKSSWNPSSDTLEPHHSQHDHSIAQHYASAVFVSLCFHSHKGKFGVQLNSYSIKFSVYVCLIVNCAILGVCVCFLVHSRFLDYYCSLRLKYLSEDCTTYYICTSLNVLVFIMMHGLMK